jgi:hypothetical protein
VTHAFNWLFVNQPTWISNLSNLTSITILSVVLAFLKKFNCESSKRVTGDRCWRVATHPVSGTTYRTCSHHVHHEAVLQADHASKRPVAHAHLNPEKGLKRGPGGRFIKASAASNADSGSEGPTSGG